MRSRLYVAGIFAGVVAIALLAVLVVGLGRFDPSPPSLQKKPQPQIPGQILFVDPQYCVVRIRASGADREQLTCAGPSVGVVSWLDENTIGYGTFGPGSPSWTVVDLATGKNTAMQDAPARQAPDPISVKGERIDYDDQGSVYRVANGDRMKVLDFDGSGHTRPQFVTWSPDGEWVLLQYRDELWIVNRDGSIKGMLAKTRPWQQSVSWWIDGHGYLPRLDLRPSDGRFPPGR